MLKIFKFKSTKNRLWTMMIITWVCFISLIISTILVIRWYNINLKPYDRTKVDEQSFVVVRGDTANQIAEKLQEANLIKDASAFKWYIRLNNKADDLQYGTFSLSQSFYVSKIVDILSSTVPADLRVTIYPGKTLREIKIDLEEQGFSVRDINEAFQIGNYLNHPLIKQGIIPINSGATLEGYLAPETYSVNQFNATSLKSLINESLDKFEQEFLDSYIREKLNQLGKISSDNPNSLIHEAVILASIIEQEVPNEADRKIVAQVFLKRLNLGMKLGSDVTFIYIAKEEDRKADVNDPSLYNTRVHSGLPPGPISNFSKNALLAVVEPSQTEYLYFVAGDDGVIHFNETYAEHQADANKYCLTGCVEP